MPIAFQSQRKSARNLVLAANKQSSPNGVFADAALVRRQEFDGSSVLDLTPTRRDNKSMSGTGTQFATNNFITGWDSKFPFKADADDWLLGWALAFVFGTDTVTGSAAPYTHSFAFDFSTDDAPLTNVYLEDTADVKYKLQDMAVSDVTITIPAKGPLTLDISLMGTGRWTDGAMTTVPSPPATFRYLLGSDCIFSLGPVGSTAQLDGRHMTTAIKISTGVVNHVASGGGLYGIKMRRGDLSFSVTTTVAAKQSDDVRTLLNNDTLSTLTWAINSGAQATLNFTLSNVKLKANKLGMNGEMLVWQITADQTSILALGGASPLTVTLANSVASYLAAI